MGSKTDYLEAKVLDHVIGGVTYTPPANLFFGLSTGTITDAGGGIMEPSGGGYARVSVVNNTTNFPAASGTATTKANGTLISFPGVTAPWGNLTDFFVADALSAGNILYYGTLTTPKSPTAGDTVQFPAGSLTFTET